jgi:CDP-diglyceride synthetase
MALGRKTLVKPMAGGALVGLLVALVVIYLLRPLNNGAIGLIILICVSLFTALGKLFSRRKE